MTTIAVKAGVMACDSCWTDSNGLHGTSLNKITRLKSGALLGEAGDNDSRAVVKLLQNVKNYDQMPSAQELESTRVDYAALILFLNGETAEITITRHEGGSDVHFTAGSHRVNRGGAAVGTGAMVAIGSMDAGKSAREAVEIACRRDPYSKGPVYAVALKVEKPVRKRGSS